MTDLGYLVFLNYCEDTEARQSLEDGLRLVERAEQLGYDTAWVRVHHHVRTLSSPFTFLTAAALRSSRIRLGTAVIPVGYEDPLRFAEDAATADLLSGGRLELGLSSGVPHGSYDAEERARLVAARLRDIRSAIDGESLGELGDAVAAPAPADAAGAVRPLPHGPVGPPLEAIAYPRSPGLGERLWYGAGSRASALRAAELGYHLVLSTIHGERTAPTLGETQAAVIREYRDAFAAKHPGRTARVAIGRSILPIVGAAEREEYGELADFYERFVTPDGRYTDALDAPGQASPLYSGEPAEIIDRLSDDPAIELADEVVLTPLSELTVEQKLRLFESVAEHIAPQLRVLGA